MVSTISQGQFSDPVDRLLITMPGYTPGLYLPDIQVALISEQTLMQIRLANVLVFGMKGFRPRNLSSQIPLSSRSDLRSKVRI